MNFRHLQGDFWSDSGSFGVPWGGILVTLGGPWTGWYFSEFQGVARGGPKALGIDILSAGSGFLA